jgi:hypothetical protein
LVAVQTVASITAPVFTFNPSILPDTVEAVIGTLNAAHVFLLGITTGTSIRVTDCLFESVVVDALVTISWAFVALSGGRIQCIATLAFASVTYNLG